MESQVFFSVAQFASRIYKKKFDEMLRDLTTKETRNPNTKYTKTSHFLRILV